LAAVFCPNNLAIVRKIYCFAQIRGCSLSPG